MTLPTGAPSLSSVIKPSPSSIMKKPTKSNVRDLVGYPPGPGDRAAPHATVNRIAFRYVAGIAETVPR